MHGFLGKKQYAAVTFFCKALTFFCKALTFFCKAVTFFCKTVKFSRAAVKFSLFPFYLLPLPFYFPYMDSLTGKHLAHVAPGSNFAGLWGQEA